MLSKNLISIIIPIHNEQDNITNLSKEIINEMSCNFQSNKYEIIFVNDGSIDKSRNEILETKNNNKDIDIIAINLQRNYGQAIALDV
jgi:glycosyltransferase involved in cell wall biosynthesis